MPTGGVDATEESITQWIKAGTACLGIGTKLITKEIVAAGDWEALTAKVAQCLWWVKKARGVPLFLGCEHVGLYPTQAGGGAEVAAWYAKTFSFSERWATHPSSSLAGPRADRGVQGAKGAAGACGDSRGQLRGSGPGSPGEGSPSKSPHARAGEVGLPQGPDRPDTASTSSARL